MDLLTPIGVVPGSRTGREHERGANELRLARLLAGIVADLMEEQPTQHMLDRVVRGLSDLRPGSASGLMLVDECGGLGLVASSDESARALELFQLQRHDGPCVEAAQTGGPVEISDVAEARERWPDFVAGVVSRGYRSVLALPMTAPGGVIGCANVFSPRAADREAVETAQVVVDATTAALAAHRRLDELSTLTQQLERALQSRVVVEQAKGLLAAEGHIGVDDAFERLRQSARRRRTRIDALARDVVDRRLTSAEVL